MHTWNKNKLIDELAEGSLSEWGMTQYLIATSVLWTTRSNVTPMDITTF